MSSNIYSRTNSKKLKKDELGTVFTVETEHLGVLQMTSVQCQGWNFSSLPG